MAELETVRNVGPALAGALRSAGIADAVALRALGTDAAYGRLVEAGARPHFIGYYALEMGLQGRPWNDCRGEEKAALRARFDAVVARSRPRDADAAAFEAMMDAIGVIEPR
ncbi:TfoX/Sxy family DNA transformation protein [Jannaschia sp. Os4]|uniref:TfoX/Sxy family DNA transformation protein n=1 Tax=Jannaschia sp. Os4 TaxID=2807617 RepID=UPI00193ADA32|nr:TfoX/Sxy family DNA transformation protein [Jannaschia sp. Os4]MBM2577059.1 TfoX/Sxy family DNA transformation protein [Jannaschia sp. Os4]